MVTSLSICPPLSTLDFYTVLNSISSAQTSKVKLVQNTLDSSLCICKIQKIRPFLNFHAIRSKFYQEVRVLKSCQHENIIKILDFSDCSCYYKHKQLSYECMYYIIEYCPQGDLFQLINNNPSGLGEETGKILFRQVAESINYLHLQGFAHGDIRLENFVIGDDQKVKMIDFEFIKPVHVLSNEFNGSNYYMAPEILRHEEFLPEKADVFAAGCMLFSLVFGRPAFMEATRDIGLYKSLCNTPTVFWQNWERATNIKISPDLKNLLENMLLCDPSQRLSISSVLSHSSLN